MPIADRLDWYFAYNLFRLAGIVQGIKKRVIDGTASHAQAAEMAKRVPMLAKCGLELRQKGGCRRLDPAHQPQDKDDDQDQAEHAGRAVTPTAAVAPARHRADQQQDEDDDKISPTGFLPLSLFA